MLNLISKYANGVLAPGKMFQAEFATKATNFLWNIKSRSALWNCTTPVVLSMAVISAVIVVNSTFSKTAIATVIDS